MRFVDKNVPSNHFTNEIVSFWVTFILSLLPIMLKDSFSRFGVVKGAYLSINRVCRCHPWNKGGVDPVPNEGCDRC